MSYAPLSAAAAVGSPLTEGSRRTVSPLQHSECMGHIYSLLSTIPPSHLFWFPPCPRKTLTITGDSRVEMLKEFREAVQNSKLSIACNLAVELHCSGYFLNTFLILTEIIGSHVHIHNPNLATHLAEQYRKFSKQLSYPPNTGTFDFPQQRYEEEFYERKEVKQLQATINSQLVRNFIAESVALVALSHQKELTLPTVKQEEVTMEHLCNVARRHKVGGTDPERIAKKNELALTLALIQRLLFYKTPKVDDAIYWIVWIIKLENKYKKNGDKLSCPRSSKVSDVDSVNTDHWVWHIWKSVFARLSRMPRFKQKQVSDVYFLFKIMFTKNLVDRKLPLLYFALRLLKYDMGNQFPAVINHLHLHVQVCANINTLYRNLMIRLARKSWTQVCELSEVQKIENQTTEKEKKEKKPTKKEIKEHEVQLKRTSLHDRTAYLDIVPTRVAFVDVIGSEDPERLAS